MCCKIQILLVYAGQRRQRTILCTCTPYQSKFQQHLNSLHSYSIYELLLCSNPQQLMSVVLFTDLITLSGITEYGMLLVARSAATMTAPSVCTSLMQLRSGGINFGWSAIISHIHIVTLNCNINLQRINTNKFLIILWYEIKWRTKL